jgi:lysylphosphatidylglycerol synthetase-like protein (DUF2156 family)
MKVTTQETARDHLSVASPLLQKDERSHIVELVRRWGGLTTDALLDPNCQIFSLPQLEGFIGYQLVRGCAIVYGDPICSPSDVPQLAHAFQTSYQGQCKNIIYLMASEKFAQWAIPHLCKASVEYGEEIFLDPHCDPQERHGTHASLVRRKVRHAQHEGVSIREYLVHDGKMEQALEQVSTAWLQSRRGPQVHISNVHLFTDRLGKRWFYAHQEEHIVGVVVLNQVQKYQGWHLNHLMLTPQAPHGTPEFLITSVLEALKSENCSFVSFGVAPVDRLGTLVGLTPLSTWMARHIYHIASKIFHLKGHKMFWGKFYPQTRPSYLLFHQPSIGLREICALMRAMHVSL